MKDQKLFLDSEEADNWFNRNKNHINEHQERVSLFSKYLISSNMKTLEIGCSGGWNSKYFTENNGCYYGIDPSQDAIAYANQRYPNFNFNVGYSDNLPYDDSYFDCVFLGFCLYLTDRNRLIKTVSEVDRVLKNNGHVFILDFDSKNPVKKMYRDIQGVYSYKMDYSVLWLAFPHYSLVEKIPSSHSAMAFCMDPNERLSSTTLLKNHDNAYTLVT